MDCSTFVESWQGTAIPGLILILSYREIFPSELLYEHCFLVVLFTLKLRCLSVSLGWPWKCSQILACVFTDTHGHQRQHFKPNTRLSKGWRKMGGGCREGRSTRDKRGTREDEQEERVPILAPWDLLLGLDSQVGITGTTASSALHSLSHGKRYFQLNHCQEWVSNCLKIPNFMKQLETESQIFSAIVWYIK